MRIGVIGVGTMGERHCRILASLPGISLVGVSDASEERGREVAARYRTAYYRDCETLLPELDAATIATPTRSHYEMAKACLERGLHIMVEKPIAETSAQAQELIHMAEGRGLVFQVGHIERFNPTFTELKNVVENMRLIGVTFRRLSPFELSNKRVDVILDLMIHDLDLAVDLMGEDMESLAAWGRSISTAELDHVVANLSFRGGPVATLFASRVTEQKVRAIEIVADGAYIEADLLRKSILVHRRALHQYLDARYRQESLIECIYVPTVEPLLLELQHFADCVYTGLPSRVPASDGLRALRLAETIAEVLNDPFYSRDFTPS